MNPDYKRLAYERTLVTELRRHLMGKYVDGGGGSKSTLQCDALPYEDREVPQDAVVEMVQRLEAEEHTLNAEMTKYDFRKQDVRPLPRAQDLVRPIVPGSPVVGEPAAKPRGKSRKARA